MSFVERVRMLKVIFGSAERAPVRNRKKREKSAKFVKTKIYVERA
jgi:hypothetical protein